MAVIFVKEIKVKRAGFRKGQVFKKIRFFPKKLIRLMVIEVDAFVGLEGQKKNSKTKEWAVRLKAWCLLS